MSEIFVVLTENPRISLAHKHNSCQHKTVVMSMNNTGYRSAHTESERRAGLPPLQAWIKNILALFWSRGQPELSKALNTQSS